MSGSLSSAFAVLLLADGRFPAGGHAHSAGVEAAVADGRVHDEATLEAYVRGRLRTAGLADAALSAATATRVSACDGESEIRRALLELDAEAAARIAAPPLRVASRRLGRQLARVASRCWPGRVLACLSEALPGGAHLAVALGAAGAAAGVAPADVARLAVHHAIATPAQAAVRLLGLDPFAVAGLAARLAALAEEMAGAAVASAAGPLDELPAPGAPIVDIAAVEHERRELRMFAT